MASAETEEIRTSANRKVYAEVMRYTQMLGNVPIYILGGFNPTIKGGPELKVMRKKGGWRDAMEEWVQEGGVIIKTYCLHGAYEGMAGTGVTRPDRAYTIEAGLPSHSGGENALQG